MIKKFNNIFLSSKRKLRTVVLASFLLGGEVAMAAQQQINSSGGTATDGSNGIKIHVIDNGQLQIVYKNLTQVYAPSIYTENTSLFNGMYLAVGNRATGSNNGTDGIDIPVWGEGAQTLIGTGIGTDPYVVTTTLFTTNDGNVAYDSAIDTQVEVETIYVSPAGYFTERITVTPPASNTLPIKFYHSIDTYLSGGDNGPAFSLPQNLASTNDTVGNPSLVSVRKDPGGPNDSFEGFVEVEGSLEFSHWMSGQYNSRNIYANIPSGGDIINTWNTNASTDNGIAVQFDLEAINSPTTFEYYIAFSGEAKINLDLDNSSGSMVPGGYKSTYLLGGTSTSILDTDTKISNVIGDIQQVRIVNSTYVTGDMLNIDVATLPANISISSQTDAEIILTAPVNLAQKEEVFELALQSLSFSSTSSETHDRSFDFRVTNELGEEGSASAGFLTLHPNTSPVISNRNHTIDTAETATLDLLNGVTDADGDELYLVSVNGVSLTGAVQTITVPNGEVRIDSNGNMLFVPTVGILGSTTFPYVVSDGIATVEANINVLVTIDTDEDGVADIFDIDDDNDGIPDLVEEAGTPNRDTDEDNIPDAKDLDADNDGILDIIEAGGIDTDHNGKVDDATDTDLDGLADVVDISLDTKDAPTTFDEAKGMTKLPVIDTDGDGKRDFQDIDSDNDGLSDLVEGGIDISNDTDNDGKIDSAVDSDGIADVVNPIKGGTPANTPDSDGDSVPNYRDLDSDNDGLLDIAEAGGVDSDGDGNGLDDTPNESLANPMTDSNSNNTPDVLEPNNDRLAPVLDENLDGVIDNAIDADNDGIPDVTDERPLVFATAPTPDADGDGLADRFDIDDDNDGIPDLVEEAGTPTRDMDGDGVIDSKDLDSDNDGILDIVEAGGVDIDSNGRVDTLTDDDLDGLVNIADRMPSNADTPTDAESAKIVTLLPVGDTDGDTKLDFQDVDSDNDGISDLIEGGTNPALDGDHDGMITKDPAQVDKNGVATGLTPANNPDVDSDGTPDYRDLDSDNDGLLDVVEAGGIDSDGNGLVDTPDILVTTLPDVDGDGTPDVSEPNNPKLPVQLDGNGDGIIDDATDADRDGIPDVADETDGDFATTPLADTDRDGIADKYDIDDDNDGIPDLVEDNGDATRDTDDDGVIDSKDLDSDNDGILDIVEAGGVDIDNNGLVADATDGDNDGLANIVDTNATQAGIPTSFDEAKVMTTLPIIDTDGDSKRDFQDVDSDNDGLSDVVEAGTPATNDADSDGHIDGAVDENGIPTVVTPIVTPVDTDSDSVPNYRDLDSDNDGLNDTEEVDAVDANRDGIVDTEDSLVDGIAIPDMDGDNIPDVNEPSNENLPAVIDTDGDKIIDTPTDSDKDGIPDVIDGKESEFGTEPLLDTDGDKIPNIYDLDDDNDGIADLIEEDGNPLRDTDGDRVVDRLDLDADNDGILDIIEANGMDANSDGRVDSAIDNDNDGLANSADLNTNRADAPTDKLEALMISELLISDTDEDGKRDFQDVDSDNDGISDMIEAGTDASHDADSDGMIDGEVDADGITTVVTPVTSPIDTDNDTVPNYRDLDSDNDGLNDVEEAGGEDAQSDGQIDTPDTLVDGSAIPDTNGTANPLVPNNDRLPAMLDRDGDGIIDDDIDSDGDGIPDVLDGTDGIFATLPMLDTDSDGIPDEYDIDDDNDGITDLVEQDGDDTRDTDGDGIIDSRDLDSDNDGILDIVEAGGVDSENNGFVDNASDSDNDGLANIADRNATLPNEPADFDEAVAITMLPIVDTDEDNKLDFQDIDSDNDGLSDLIEGGTPFSFDSDNDGMIDTNATNDANVTGDVDSDGIFDVVDVDRGGEPAPVEDIDGDGKANYRDGDSDGDGLSDISEVNAKDEDEDGEMELVDGASLPDSNANGTPNVYEKRVVSRPIYYGGGSSDSEEEETPEIEEEEPVVEEEIEDSIEASDNVETMVAGEVVTIDLLENDAGDIDVDSVEIIIPEGFEPNFVLEAGGQILTVAGEGVWTLDGGGVMTFTPEEGFVGRPTDIEYMVLNLDRTQSATASISLNPTAVAGVSYEIEDVCQTSDSVSSLGGVGLFLMMVVGSIFGMLFARREEKQLINYSIRKM